MSDKIGFLYSEKNERVFITDYEPTAKKFARYWKGFYKLSPTGFWLVTI